MRKIPVLLVLITLVLSGCGGNKNDETPASSAATLSDSTAVNNPTISSPESSLAFSLDDTAVNNVVSVSDKDEYISLCPYKGLEIETGSNIYASEITDADVETAIKSYLENYVSYKPAPEKEIEKGVFVTISYDATARGQNFPKSSERFPFEVGNQNTFPGLDEQLFGKRVGDTYTATITFPDNHYDNTLKGKSIELTGKIIDVSLKVYPELTDEFVANELGAKAKTVSEYKEEVKKLLEKSNAGSIKFYMIDYLRRNSKIIKYPDGVTTDGDKSIVKDDLIFGAIADKENIKVEDSDYKKYMSEILLENEFKSEDELYKLYSKERVEKLVLRKKVLDYLATVNTLVKKK